MYRVFHPTARVKISMMKRDAAKKKQPYRLENFKITSIALVPKGYPSLIVYDAKSGERIIPRRKLSV